MSIADFPNLFTIAGPGSPVAVSNMRMTIELQVDWIADCITHLDANQLATIEATEEAKQGWSKLVSGIADRTILPRYTSYLVSEKSESRVFMPYLGGVPGYRDTCAQIAADSFRGFQLGASWSR